MALKLLAVLAVGSVGGVLAVSRLLGPAPKPLKRHNPVHVTMSGACPRSIEGIDGVGNPDATLLDELMVPANPTGVKICRYGPDSSGNRAGKAALKGYVMAGRVDALRLTQDLNNISDPGISGELLTCPIDLGNAVDLLVFAFDARSDVDVWFDRSGCVTVDNGYTLRVYRTRPTIDQFDRFSRDLDGVVIAHGFK
jgi:hypothetical protein